MGEVRTRYLMMRDVAEKLGTHVSYVRANWARWHVEFKLPVFRMGGGQTSTVRFKESDIDHMIELHWKV